MMKLEFKYRNAGKIREALLSAASSLRYLCCSVAALLVLSLGCGAARASIAYGSINNFDTVNDTGVPAYGFEIELDDIHSADISYTYDWNHYGTNYQATIPITGVMRFLRLMHP